VCLSKGLTGGMLALSAVLTTEAVYRAFYDDDVARGFLHSHSYTGNPLACRAALAVLEVFEREQVLARNEALARVLDEVFEPMSRHPRVRHARRLGMVWAWDVDDAPAGFSRSFHRRALEHGVLLRPIGTTVYAMPPYAMDVEAGEWLVRGAVTALDAVLGSPAP
jgi:adenosylmethionine-8-amino-7-oxononanoate aminotransferase